MGMEESSFSNLHLKSPGISSCYEGYRVLVQGISGAAKLRSSRPKLRPQMKRSL